MNLIFAFAAGVGFITMADSIADYISAKADYISAEAAQIKADIEKWKQQQHSEGIKNSDDKQQQN